MKVLLIYSAGQIVSHTQQNIIPNGLYYIASLLLEHNIDAEILNLTGRPENECNGIIAEKKPDLIGVSCFTFNRHAGIALAGIAKSVDKHTIVIFGGPHASMMAEQLLANFPDIDAISLNESEYTFLEVAQKLADGSDWQNTPGIVYMKGSQVIFTEKRKPIADLDSLPIPAKYFPYKRIVTSRGCPGRCIFCETPALWGSKVRLRSVNNVVDELELLHNKYGLSFFIMSDDTFTFDKQRTIEICMEILRRGLKITWDCRSRVNFICDERMSWMKKAGCITISYGIESGSQQILNNLRKGITVNQIRAAAALSRKYGMNLNYYIIIGSPGETDDTVRETMKLIEDTRPTSVFVYMMQLTPGTILYSSARQQGIVKDTDWLEMRDESFPYSAEHSIESLNRYISLTSELASLTARNSVYIEPELGKIMEASKGPEDLIHLAHLKMAAQDFDSAMQLLEEALSMNSGSSEAMMNKAVLLAMKEDNAAIELFKKSIAADPENLLAYQNLGIFLYKQKRYEEAAGIFKKAIDIEPADIRFYNYLGSVYGRIGDYETSLALFENALKIDPGNRLTLRNIAVTKEKMR